MNLYIVRHGQTYTNLKKIVCGQFNTTLTELGHEQARNAAKVVQSIDFDYYYCSPLERAMQTAQYFNSVESFTLVPEIMEMNTGDYSELTVEELINRNPKLKYQGRNRHELYPNGESLNILYSRIINWVSNESLKWPSNSNILIVGHEATVSCLIHYYLEIPLMNYPSFIIKNGTVTCIDIELSSNQVRVDFNKEYHS